MSINLTIERKWFCEEINDFMLTSSGCLSRDGLFFEYWLDKKVDYEIFKGKFPKDEIIIDTCESDFPGMTYDETHRSFNLGKLENLTHRKMVNRLSLILAQDEKAKKWEIS